MSFRKRLFASAIGASSAPLLFMPASASTIDVPSFEVEPLVIVWAADEATGTAPLAVDFLADIDGIETDLIASDGRTLVSGSLLPTRESFAGTAAGESWVVKASGGSTIASFDTSNPAAFSPFDAAGTSVEVQGVSHHIGFFFVASNTAFNIRSDVLSSQTDGDFSVNDITFSIITNVSGTHGGLAFGSNAQHPAGSDNATSLPINAYFGGPGTLQAADGADVFVGTRATALSDGNIVEQSVRFRPQYTLNNDLFLDLSTGTGEIQAEIAYTVYVP